MNCRPRASDDLDASGRSAALRSKGPRWTSPGPRSFSWPSADSGLAASVRPCADATRGGACDTLGLTTCAASCDTRKSSSLRDLPRVGSQPVQLPLRAADIEDQTSCPPTRLPVRRPRGADSPARAARPKPRCPGQRMRRASRAWNSVLGCPKAGHRSRCSTGRSRTTPKSGLFSHAGSRRPPNDVSPRLRSRCWRDRRRLGPSSRKACRRPRLAQTVRQQAGVRSATHWRLAPRRPEGPGVSCASRSDDPKASVSFWRRSTPTLSRTHPRRPKPSASCGGRDVTTDFPARTSGGPKAGSRPPVDPLHRSREPIRSPVGLATSSCVSQADPGAFCPVAAEPTPPDAPVKDPCVALR